MVFEGWFYKDNTTSPELHIITLGPHETEMNGNLIINVIHVGGTRMKELGIDSLSRGKLLEGVMAGQDTLEMLPLDMG